MIFDVERERPVLNVVEVQPHPFFKGEVAAAADLPVTGHPGDGLEPPLVCLLHPVEIPHRQGPWTYQAHLPFKDVHELGQLVDAPASSTDALPGSRGGRPLS